MKRTEESAVLTPAKAEKRLKMRSNPPGSQLKRLIEAKERELGKRIFLRTPGRHRKVTMSAIRRYLPELMPSVVDELARRFQAYVRDIDSRIASLVGEEVAENIEPRYLELWARDETIAKVTNQHDRRLTTLEKQVAKLARKRA